MTVIVITLRSTDRASVTIFIRPLLKRALDVHLSEMDWTVNSWRRWVSLFVMLRYVLAYYPQAVLNSPANWTAEEPHSEALSGSNATGHLIFQSINSLL
jgi:hypothetical protein